MTATATAAAAAIAAAALSTSGSSDNFSIKARQEVFVMQRISELQRDGMWTDRRLPKCQEPQRTKAHWDYLLEEMVWLASDFAQERKWKKAAAKKCSRMVLKYFTDKALAAQRAEKAQEMQLRRIAAAQAKEIKVFWSNVEKLVEYKQHTHITEKRKQAMDQHLSFIVDQTERFSKQLAVGMNKFTGASLGGGTSTNASSPVPSDVEFSPGNASSDDDEETIALAERDDAAAHDVRDEIAALQKESEMDLDEFLNELPANYLKDREGLILGESKQGSDADEDDDDDDDSVEDDNEHDEIAEKTEKKKPTVDTVESNEHGSNKENLRRLRGNRGNVTTSTTGVSASSSASVAEDDTDDGEYCAKEQSDDDEDTIKEQEANERIDHQKEIDELNVSQLNNVLLIYIFFIYFLYICVG